MVILTTFKDSGARVDRWVVEWMNGECLERYEYIKRKYIQSHEDWVVERTHNYSESELARKNFSKQKKIRENNIE